ncbi:MAG TPA: hypothetical protein VGB98_00200 [Pyrinomonadaceae bacterium]|jgi:hypothetical protein
MKFFTLIFALLVLSVVVSAQDTPAVELKSKYDRYENKTTVTLSELVMKGPDVRLYLGAAASFDGERPKEWTPRILLSISIISKMPLKANDAELYALLDGTPFEIGSLEPIAFKPDGIYSLTMYGVLLPAERLSRIATAKKAEMRFDGVEFALSDAQQLKIIEFLRMTRP